MLLSMLQLVSYKMSVSLRNDILSVVIGITMNHKTPLINNGKYQQLGKIEKAIHYSEKKIEFRK